VGRIAPGPQSSALVAVGAIGIGVAVDGCDTCARVELGSPLLQSPMILPRSIACVNVMKKLVVS
jgi:hypothetical protein